MTFIGIAGSRLSSSKVCVSSSTISTILPVFLHSSTKHIRMQQVTMPTSIHQVTVQPSALYPSIHDSCMAPECTTISLAVARFTAAKAREAREMYSVSHVSFGAELGRPLTRLMFDSSHNITKRFPIQMFRHQVCGIDCASDLLDPGLLVLLFLLQPIVLRFHMLDCAAPASESQSARYCSICPDSHLSFVAKLSYRIGQSEGLNCTAYHAVVF